MQLNLHLIKQLRNERGWTQQQLADICAVSLRTVQRVEMQGVASLETCKALAAAFVIEREQLLIRPDNTDDSNQPGQLPRMSLWIGGAFTLGLTAGMLLTLLLSS
ncbi:MAG: helix-turn-helix transcriptional regulator [Rheinheimera sp.]|nr:helix-turn-helix transcriptional regulator [Rheinheimera sp.]